MAEKLLLTMDTCGGCQAVKRALKDKLDDGSLREVKASSDEGRKIAKELNLHSVPSCIEYDDGKYKECDLEELLDEAEDSE
jgi:hypothetical protein